MSVMERLKNSSNRAFGDEDESSSSGGSSEVSVMERIQNSHNRAFEGDNSGNWLGNGDPVSALIDIPADAVNATTGTGKNTGWFGKFDKWADPRQVKEGEWADPTDPRAQGLSGFFAGGTGATTSLGKNLGEVTTKPALAFLGLDKMGGGGSQQQQPQEEPKQSGGSTLLLLGGLAAAGAFALGVFN